jgi:diadenosine tetraphosphate (Ap4A) HIT family hydrolase
MDKNMKKDCLFCYDNVKDRIIAEQGSVVAIEDKYPVCDGHLLIVPKRHAEDYFSMTETEKRDADRLILVLRDRMLAMDSSVTGFNIGSNTGKSAGQTIFHAHIHFIPRRDGDTTHPRGGVRGVIPDKMGY